MWFRCPGVSTRLSSLKASGKKCNQSERGGHRPFTSEDVHVGSHRIKSNRQMLLRLVRVHRHAEAELDNADMSLNILARLHNTQAHWPTVMQLPQVCPQREHHHKDVVAGEEECCSLVGSLLNAEERQTRDKNCQCATALAGLGSQSSGSGIFLLATSEPPGQHAGCLLSLSLSPSRSRSRQVHSQNCASSPRQPAKQTEWEVSGPQ